MAAKKKGDSEPKGGKDGQPSSGKQPAPKEPDGAKIVPPKEPAGEPTPKPQSTKEKSEGPLSKTATTKEANTGKDAKDKDAKKKKEDESVGEQIKDLRQFLKEVVIEFRKISWPERSQVVRETGSVLFLVAIITLMVLAFDWVLANGFFGPLEHWARLHGGGVGVGR